MRLPRRGALGRSARWTSGTVLAVALAGTAVAAGPMAASAQAAVPAHASKSAVVVKQARRDHFGKILVNLRGHALYMLPHGSCTGGCLQVWPRLTMPKGKTMPKGASCLGTAKFGSHHQLQVTYHGHRLYMFAEDMGTSVNGNGVAGFRVAKVVKCR